METSLSYRARLVHAEPGRRVVQVSAWQGSACLGSSLAEAGSADLAEDQALARLQQRLQLQPPPPPPPSERTRHALVRREDPQPQPELTPAALAPAPAPVSESTPPPPEPPADPDDWSDELAEIDIQLQRLGWDRNQESTYLQRAFGHPSRNRITHYADLSAYLRGLRGLPEGSDPANATVPLRRKDLLDQSDQLLQSLRWDANRGRQMLEQNFQLSSRQQLSDEQLLSFNMLLETELLSGADSGSAVTAAALPG